MKTHQQVKYHCLYCGEPTKRGRKGEHIIPEAIRGARTLNEVPGIAVCQGCNSGVLSLLDKELCSRSYLSVIASRELGAHLWQTWEVDHGSDNLLLEARPAWTPDKSLKALVCYPQITFERTGPAVHGDAQEFAEFGNEHAVKVLFQAARRCFHRHMAGAKGALNLERVRSGAVQDGYRLPPRVYAPHPIASVAENVRKQSFVLRFVNSKDREFALDCLSNLNGPVPMKKWGERRGSHQPAMVFFFDVGTTVQALMKIGLNLLAAYCTKTQVNHESFATAIRIIRGKMPIPPLALAGNGFVRPKDVEQIAAADSAHSFRLVHMNGTWYVYSSFFGGQVGAFVQIPGPNNEEWQWAEIVAPLASKEWTVDRGVILRPMPVKVEWKDGRAVIPSIEFQRTVSSINIQPVKKKASTG